MNAGGVVLDAGALLAIERGDRRVHVLLAEAERAGREVRVVAGVLAQAWRGGARQSRLARVLNASNLRVVPLDEPDARAVGALCGSTGHHDVVDVHVVLEARRSRSVVVTSDEGDLRRVDPGLPVVRV